MATPDALATLKIDRAPRRHSRRIWPWLAMALAVAAVIVTVPYYRSWQSVEVSVAPVVKITAAASGTGSGSGGELSAAGYVVADRQSTLAAKVTGRLVRLNVSEAQRVKAGEVRQTRRGTGFHHKAAGGVTSRGRRPLQGDRVAHDQIRQVQGSGGSRDRHTRDRSGPDNSDASPALDPRKNRR